MAPDRAILLIDLPGFGESDRTMLNEQDPESDWLASITSVISSELDQGEYWLGGHSFGAYLAGLVALQNDSKMAGVILMDAWGYAVMNETFEEKIAKLRWWQRGLYHTFKGSKMTGLDLMRKFPESMSRSLMKTVRKDLTQRYGEYFMDYTFDINSQKPASGEIAFSQLGQGFGFAKNPMETRFIENLKSLPNQVHFIYGGNSWVSPHSGQVIEEELTKMGKSCSVTIIPEATHHLMCTNPDEFNQTVNKILEM